jgi:predicted RNA binding protein YcfA (HicA-like mRNA interferase family)
MPTLPVISGKQLVALLEKNGFILTRINGSHHRMKHPDGRITTVPVHKNQDLPKGLLHKIIRDDLQLTIDQFCEWVNK